MADLSAPRDKILTLEWIVLGSAYGYKLFISSCISQFFILKVAFFDLYDSEVVIAPG